MKKAMDLTGKVLVEVNANGEKRQYKTKRWKNIDVAIKEIDKKLKKNHIKSIEHVNFKSKTSDKVISGMDIVQDYRDSGSTDTIQQYIKKNYIINKKSKKEIEKLKKNKKDKANKDKENKNDKENLDKNKKRRYTQISPEKRKALCKQLNEEFEKYYGEYIGKKLETYYGKILITPRIKEHINDRHLDDIDKGLIPKSFETLISPDGGFPTKDIRGIEAWCVYKEYENIPFVAAFIRNGEIASTYTLKKHEKLDNLIERGKDNDKKDIGQFLDVE